MCGINGILRFDRAQNVEPDLIIKMRDILQHRGPNGSGLFCEGNLGFGHRRLAILDTSEAGQQPFRSENGRYIMVYNGEIYNFRDFYSELKAAGLPCHTNCDTEVLLKLFQLYGISMLKRLNGMFAFAIWDRHERRLTLARDRMGVKPLYYSVIHNSLYFASEQKALFAAGVPLKISDEGLKEYVYNRFVAGASTLFGNVSKILPGHVMTVDSDGQIVTEKWWDLSREILSHPPIHDPVDWFKSVFDDSVRLRMISDVPVGVLLSGGLDSSSILGSLYSQKYRDIQTFNVGFSERAHDESYLARKVAAGFGYGFQTMELNDEDLYSMLKESTYLQDEPIMHLSEPHLLALSKRARPAVQVLLSGEGADELMGGYVRYKPLQFPSVLKFISALDHFKLLKRTHRYDKLIRYARIRKKSELVIFNGSNIYPDDIMDQYKIDDQPQNTYRREIFAEAERLYPDNPRRQALFFDQHTYLCSLLDRNDRCTMGASIECREPFLDPRLITGLGALEDKWLFSGKKGKFILKKSMESRLPAEIVNFRKIGLSTPWEKYLTENDSLRGELSDFEKSDLFELPFFSNIDSKKLVRELAKGDNRYLSYIMPLFTMHIWLKTYVSKFA
jgi:asparagine synthase (glutamine-hydrolysing)